MLRALLVCTFRSQTRRLPIVRSGFAEEWSTSIPCPTCAPSVIDRRRSSRALDDAPYQGSSGSTQLWASVGIDRTHNVLILNIVKTVLTVYFLKMGIMPGGAGRRTSTSFEAINASSATGIPNLVR